MASPEQTPPPEKASNSLPAKVSTSLPPITLRQYLALGTALWGSFESSLGSQLASAGLVDIQGGLGVSADEASWIGTVYPMAQVIAVPLAATLAQAFGARVFLRMITGLFLLSCLISGLTHTLEGEIILRFFQGLAGGSFGVTAFSLTLRLFGGRNVAPGLAALALATTLPNALGILGAAQFVELWGWQAIYLVEVVFSVITIIGVHLFMDIECFQFKAFDNLDWSGFFLLAPAAALIIMAISQGDRRFWTEAPWIGYSFMIGAVLLLAFIYLESHRENPLVRLGVAFYPSFGLACLINMLFRAALLDNAVVTPRFLASQQSYKNLETSSIFLLPAIAQTLMYVAMPIILRFAKQKFLVGLGFALLAVGAFCDSDNTSLSAADQFLISQLIIGLAPPVFLVSLLSLGTRDVKPQDGRSAGIFWNYSIIFGTLGSATMSSYIIRMREYYHSNRLNDYLNGGRTITADHIDGVAGSLGSRLTDDNTANVIAVASTAQATAQQALLLALNDMYMIVGAIALLSILLVFKLPSQQQKKATS
jgi:DHA2 family multidrug resistance protein